MKKIIVGCLVLSMAGAFAAQEPKQEARMMPVEDLVQDLSRYYVFGPAQRVWLKAKLDAVASPGGLVELSYAERAAKDIAGPQGMQVQEVDGDDGGEGKVGKAGEKTAEHVKIEGVVREFLPGPLAELVGSYVPAAWNIQFERSDSNSTEQALPWGRGIDGLQASANGRYVAVQKGKKTVDIWDMQSMAKVKTITFEVEGRRWVFSPAFDRAVALIPGKNKIAIVDVRSGKLLKSISGFARGVGFFEEDSGKFSLIGYNHQTKSAFKWDMLTGELVKMYPLDGFLGEVEGPEQAVVFSVDGKLIAGEKAGELIVWDVERNKLVQKIKLRKGLLPRPSTFAFSFDSKELAVTDFDPRTIEHSILVWNLVTGENLDGMFVEQPGDGIGSVEQPGDGIGSVEQPGDGIGSMVFSPAGRCILTGSSRGATAWEYESEEISTPEEEKPAALQEESKREAELKQQAAAPAVEPSAGPVSGAQVKPVHRVTVDEFMETLEFEGMSLVEESQREDIRKILRDWAQGSPDNKIEESLAQQLVDDMLHGAAPRELAEQSDDDLPPLEDYEENVD